MNRREALKKTLGGLIAILPGMVVAKGGLADQLSDKREQSLSKRPLCFPAPKNTDFKINSEKNGKEE